MVFQEGLGKEVSTWMKDTLKTKKLFLIIL